MFASIKQALTKDEKSNARKDILRFAPGNTYTVRILPNVDDPAKTFFHYFQIGWKSFATGQYISLVSPSTFGERDPIAEERYKINRSGSEADKEKAKAIIRSEKWLVNAYIIDDPVNPENKGTVKILRYGKQLHKVIDAAINGDDSAEFGSKLFDLSKDGVNLKIKCESQGEYPTFVSSRFTSPSDLHLSPEKISDIYGSICDLESAISVRTYDELVSTYKDHYLVLDSINTVATVSAPKQSNVVSVVSVDEVDSSINDAEVDAMLKDL